MLRHKDIWRGIDQLAAECGISVSRLACEAGLDPTAFNKSKRFTRDHQPRWPTTESVSKILVATGRSFAEFSTLVGEDGGAGGLRHIYLIGLAQAGAGGYFDDSGYPTDSGWDRIRSPGVDDPHAYALKITGDSMEPVYREGDLIIVSPQARVRAGDRVVLKTRDGEVMAKLLARQTLDCLDLHSMNPEHPDRILPVRDVAWVSRILWVSQ
jgi:phage repressor protein C with HTH and peptisase S24 domain